MKRIAFWNIGMFILLGGLISLGTFTARSAAGDTSQKSPALGQLQAPTAPQANRGYGLKNWEKGQEATPLPTDRSHRQKTRQYVELQRTPVPGLGFEVVYRAAKPDGPATIQAAGRGLPSVIYADGSDLTDSGSGPAAELLSSRLVVPQTATVAQLNKDTAGDLISGFVGPAGGVLTVRLGRGDGTFEPPVSYTVEIQPNHMVTGDFNNDRNQDVILAQAGVKSLLFLPGQGDGTFGPPERIILDGTPTALLAADFSPRDLREELIVAVQTEKGSHLLIWQNRKGTLKATPRRLDMPSEVVALAAGQFTNDWNLDLAVATLDRLLVFAGTGPTGPRGGPTLSAAQVSMDPDDGDPDSRVEQGFEGNQMNGDTTPTESRPSLAPGSAEWQRRFERVEFDLFRDMAFDFHSTALAVGDFDDDRWHDVAVLDSAGHQVVLYRNQQGRDFTPVAQSISSQAVGMVASNVNGDGSMDLVLVDEEANQLAVLQGSQDGQFKAPVMLDVDSRPAVVASARLLSKAYDGLVVLKKGEGTTALALPEAAGDILVTTLTDEFNQDNVVSLREAIVAANIVQGPNQILFSVGGIIAINGPALGALPALSDTTGGTVIDGSSAPAYVIVDGNDLGCAGCSGIKITSDGNTVNDIRVQDFDIDGINIDPSDSNMILRVASAFNSQDGFDIEDGNFNILEDCIGYMCGDDGFDQDAGTGNEFVDCASGFNGDEGFDIDTGGQTIRFVDGNALPLFIPLPSIAGGNGDDGVDILGDGTVVMDTILGADIATFTPGNTQEGVEIGEFLTPSNGNLVDGNRITGNLGDAGVDINDGTANMVTGNNASTNADEGVEVEGDGNTVEGNMIMGNTDVAPAGGGVLIEIGADGNTVRDNTISGNTDSGVAIGGNNNLVDPNTITGNTGDGVFVGAGGTGNAISQNSIFDNGDLGIDLDDDGVTPNDPDDPDAGTNNLQNFPVILDACDNGGTALVDFSIDSLPANSAYPITVEFFSNTACDPTGFGEGETYVTSVMVAAPGTVNDVVLPGASAGDIITASATDAAGNTSEFSECFTVTADVTPPVITCPAMHGAECGIPVMYTATATDDCDPNPTVTCVPPSGSTFPVGTTTVTCTATDASGNSGMCSFTVTAFDALDPVITCPADITTLCTSPAGAVVRFTATATDVCDPAPAVVCAPASGSTFPIGTTTVTCTATDASGNTDMCSFTVTVEQEILVLQDDNSGNCLRLMVCGDGTGTYCYQTPAGTFIGPVVVMTQNPTTLNIQSGPGDPNLLQGGISLDRRRGNARLTVPGVGTFTIFDTNIDDSTCVCP